MTFQLLPDLSTDDFADHESATLFPLMAADRFAELV